MSISNDIKKLLIDKDMTLTQLAKIIAKRKGKNFSIQNLSQKLKKDTLNLQELEIIMDTLGYKICYLPQKPFNC